MKKIILIFLTMFLSINLYAYMGDGMGDHKAKKNLNMNSNSIDNAKEASLSAGCTAQSFYGDGSNLTGISIEIPYSTNTLAMVFVSSDITPGCKIFWSTITYRCSTDILIKKSHILSDVSGSVSIQVSTADAVSGTFVVISSGDALSSETQYTSQLEHWSGSHLIPAGKILKFTIVEIPNATSNATYILDYWRKP